MATSTRRASWGLSSPITEDTAWQRRGRCASDDVNPDWWHGTGNSTAGRAIHECLRHCPVLAECALGVTLHPKYVAGTVRAGVRYTGTIEKPRRHGAQPTENLCERCGGRGHVDYLLACGTCGEEFASGFPFARYCGEECFIAARKARRRVGAA